RPGPAAQHLHGVVALAGEHVRVSSVARQRNGFRNQSPSWIAQEDPMIKLSPGFLTGSYPPIVTAFREGRVDYDAYARLIEFQIANGTHGVVVNGTTSEPSVLTVDERNRLVETAVEASNKRVPVVAATGSQSHAETVALTEFATKAGADALLVVTPYYIRPPQRGLVEYYADIGQRTDLPLMLYHIP